MAKKITDQDLQFRHAALYTMCFALGYVGPPTMAEAMKFWARVDAARKRGDITIPERGHYRLSQEVFRRVIDLNREAKEGPGPGPQSISELAREFPVSVYLVDEESERQSEER